MTTAIAIMLYALAMLFAYIGGILAQGGDYRSSGGANILTGLLFVVAVMLHVWG